MSILIYFAQVSFYAAILWLMYRMLWRDRMHLQQSRVFLLLSLLLPVLLPFVRLPRPTSMESVGFHEVLPAFRLNPVPAEQHFNWPDALLWLYCAIALIQLASFGLGFMRIRRTLKRGNAEQHGDFKLITKCGVGPGTIGRSIFFPSTEIDPVILEHEQAHIRYGHQFDLWFLQAIRIVFWFSPAHWLLASELKALHEFQADQDARKVTDTSAYLELLLRRSMGSTQPVLIAHFFSPQLLKRRIMMLQTQKTPAKKLLMVATIVLGAGFLSTVLYAQTKQAGTAVAANSTETKKRAYPDVPPQNLAPNYGEVSLVGGEMIYKHVEDKPNFKGNLFAWLKDNLKTDGIKVDEKTPACVVQFVVAANGEIQNPVVQKSSGVPAWDAEVMRVVKAMPAWTPGMQNGKAVPVSITLPVMVGGEGC
jgi:TonB family protein